MTMKEAKTMPGCIRLAPPRSDSKEPVAGSPAETTSGKEYAVLVTCFKKDIVIALCTYMAAKSLLNPSD